MSSLTRVFDTDPLPFRIVDAIRTTFEVDDTLIGTYTEIRVLPESGISIANIAFGRIDPAKKTGFTPEDLDLEINHSSNFRTMIFTVAHVCKLSTLIAGCHAIVLSPALQIKDPLVDWWRLTSGIIGEWNPASFAHDFSFYTAGGVPVFLSATQEIPDREKIQIAEKLGFSNITITLTRT